MVRQRVLIPPYGGSIPSTPANRRDVRHVKRSHAVGPDLHDAFRGQRHPALAHDIAHHLSLPLGRAYVGRFSDGEVNVEIMENVRGRDVFIVQPTCPPANENLMELLSWSDACQRASARADHGGDAVLRLRAPGSAAARHARADHGEAGGEHDRERGRRSRADGRPARGPDPGILRHPGRQRLRLAGAARRRVEAEVREHDRGVAGRRRRGARASAREAARRRGPRDHRQTPPAAERVEVMNIIGEVAGKTCVLIDDMVDTAGTLCQAAQALKERRRGEGGGLHHAPRALRATRSSGSTKSALDELVVTDTIPLSATRRRTADDPAACRWRGCWPRPCVASATRSP